MVSSLLILGLLTGIQRTYGHPNAAVFAVPGDNVALPCAIPSLKSCSKVNWNMSGEFQGLYTEVVKAGVPTAEQPPTVRMSASCSLHIDNFQQSDARTYVCGDGQFSAGLSLEILQMSSEEEGELKGTMEIHCFLNTFKGLVTSCNHPGLCMEWLSEANTTLKGNRFAFKSSTNCFSKLIFQPKLTDHHRTWRCQLRDNGTVKASLSYTTNIKDGIEEVFAVAGERVSFACDTSSSPVDDRLEWSHSPPHDSGGNVDGVTSHPEFTLNHLDFSLAVSKVSPGHAGDYECLYHDIQTKVLAKFRLHTLDVSAEQDGGNLTVSCRLTCTPDKCDRDISLGWAGNSQYTRLIDYHDENALVSKLVTADTRLTGDPVVCSAYREGVLMASITWSPLNTEPLAAWWLVLPLGLLLCAACGGMCFYFKKKPKKGAGSFYGIKNGMDTAHTYEDIPDQHQYNAKQSNSPSNDGFYDLLQAVNHPK